jgi:hypothetical protein
MHCSHLLASDAATRAISKNSSLHLASLPIRCNFLVGRLQSSKCQKRVFPLLHRRSVALLLASTRAGGGSIRDTRSSPGLKRTQLFRWLAPTLHSLPSSRRIPCTALRREAACSAGRSCSAVALRHELTRSSGTCTASTSV